jgi:hypothetical protein
VGEAHKHLHITSDEFDEVGAEIDRALDHVNVPEPERQDSWPPSSRGRTKWSVLPRKDLNRTAADAFARAALGGSQRGRDLAVATSRERSLGWQPARADAPSAC